MPVYDVYGNKIRDDEQSPDEQKEVITVAGKTTGKADAAPKKSFGSATPYAPDSKTKVNPEGPKTARADGGPIGR